MFTVEAQEKAKALIEIYKQEYAARYGAPPVLANEANDRTILQDLVRRVGDAFAANIIRQYLRMNGPGKEDTFFTDRGHAIKWLDTNISAVHAALATTQKKTAEVRGYNPMITFDTGCPKCERQFPVTCRASDADKHAYTTHCPACTDVVDALQITSN